VRGGGSFGRGLAAGASVLILLSGPAAAQGRPGAPPPEPAPGEGSAPLLAAGTRAPAFRLSDPRGEEFSYRVEGAAKPLLLAFFSVFCDPCRAQLPILQKIREKYPEADLAVAGVSLDGEPLGKTVEGFAKQEGYTFRVLLDRVDERQAFRVAESYRVSEIPTLYLVDGRGRIAFAGAGRVAEEELEKSLRAVVRK
jgi:peroxiredoxin